MYSSTLYVSLADAFVFFLKSLNVFRNTLVNRSTSSRVVPIAAAAVKYVVGYAECDAPKPRNSIPPTVCVSPGAMTRVPETHRENNIDPNIVGDAPTLDAHVSVIAMEIGFFGDARTRSPSSAATFSSSARMYAYRDSRSSSKRVHVFSPMDKRVMNKSKVAEADARPG